MGHKDNQTMNLLMNKTTTTCHMMAMTTIKWLVMTTATTHMNSIMIKTIWITHMPANTAVALIVMAPAM